ncbi:hypothetical protein [Pelomonas sp. SE-A7]|uniref:hypothetical protein n=1 Tax=Pelomonas sp. SE-A7 TaxID=3054953 RepID=UPI00259CAF74|nr:hypothetical protein [Pelomonas sp. SE-A7]MDM4766172.1 hypothetical protein [Pelomonas sp. SE-A7]
MKHLNLDLTQLNAAVDRLLAVTENPRHRFLLMAYARHRALEVAGRYEEIFAPDMMSPEAVYHVTAGGNDVVLNGQEQIKGLYRLWSQTNQTAFYMATEEVSVSDHYVTSISTVYQQVSGKSLRANKLLNRLPKFIARRLLEHVLDQKQHHADNNDMYLHKIVGMQMIWPYDSRGRLIGEDVYEPLHEQSELIKLDPKDVVTTARCGELMAPSIKPLPSFDEMVLGKKAPLAA